MSKRRDLSGLIVWSTVGVMVTRYSGAFTAADVGQVSGWLSDALTAGAAVSGVGMGLLDVVGTAYIADAWRRNMPARDRPWSNRYKTLTAFLIANAVEAVFILTPYTMSRIYQLNITDVLGWGLSWIWSAVVTIAPLIVVGGVIFANPNVIQSDKTPEETPAKTKQTKPIEPMSTVIDYPEDKTPIETKPAVPLVDVLTLPSRSNGHAKSFPCDKCDFIGDTQQGLAGHLKKHRKETTI